MRTRQRLPYDHQEENFWPSFTDMISTIALILFFLILIIFVKNIIIANEFNAAKNRLIDTENALLERAEEMALLNAEISEKEKNLMLLEDEAQSLKLEVEQGTIALKLSEEQILEQQKIIAMSNQELGDLRTKIQNIAVIRLSVLDRVKKAIENELLKSGLSDVGDQVLIGENGNIILNNTLLFDSNSSTIGRDGRVLVKELATVFMNILEEEDIRYYIDAIQIEGHTDRLNTTEYNRDLSAQRAISVVNYLLASSPDLEAAYGSYFVASAFSEYRPLDENDLAKNRRIEISIILKDANIQEIIDTYLKGVTGQTN